LTKARVLLFFGLRFLLLHVLENLLHQAAEADCGDRTFSCKISLLLKWQIAVAYADGELSVGRFFMKSVCMQKQTNGVVSELL
jgi:hypothetical protein